MPFKDSDRSKGGRITGDRRRQRAIEAYYEDPTRCIECDAVIEVKDRKKVSRIRKQQFCSRSCRASYYNKLRTKGKTS